jgi:hypothetical protein
MINYLNPIMSSAVVTSGTNSSYHTLSGQAEQILLCSTTTNNGYYISFDSTAAALDTTGAFYCPGDYPLLIPCNHPTYINVLGQAVGGVHITEFA